MGFVILSIYHSTISDLLDLIYKGEVDDMIFVFLK